MSKRSPKLYLDDILIALEKIRAVHRGCFLCAVRADSKTVDAVVRNLEVIGEAARQMPKDTVIGHPQIPWARMVGVRNKILHEYFGVDVEILWQTIQEDLPSLKSQVKRLSVTPEL
jgi:hypothetical protein